MSLCPPGSPCLHCDGVRRAAEEDAKPMYGNSIRLSVAAFCPDCDAIVDRLTTCHNCGNHSLMNLARVLNREVA